MKQDEVTSIVLGCSVSGFYKWKKQKRPIIELLDKYFTKDELEEFLSQGTIGKLEYLKSMDKTFNVQISNFAKSIYDTKESFGTDDEFFDSIDYLAYVFYNIRVEFTEEEHDLALIVKGMFSVYDKYKASINDTKIISSYSVASLSDTFQYCYTSNKINDFNFANILFFLTHFDNFFSMVEYSIRYQKNEKDYFQIVNDVINFCIRFNLYLYKCDINKCFDKLYSRYKIASEEDIANFDFLKFKEEIKSFMYNTDIL